MLSLGVEVENTYAATVESNRPVQELCGKVVFGIHGTEVESLS